MSPTQLVVKTEPGHLILAVDRYPVLNEAEEEELDRQGVANERLKELELREKEFLPESGPGLPPALRNHVLRFLLGLTQLRRMEPSSWSLAVAVLDLYLSRLSTSVVDQLPAVSIAILRMVGKFDGKVAESDRSSWVPLAQHMQQCLQGLGLGRGLEVTERSLCEQEITILQTLDWQLDLPFFEQWITVYCSRLGVFSDASKDRVTWVEHRCICFSRLLTFREAACADAAPRLLSLGLVCLALVWGHLLPWQQLCPDDRNNWQSRFQQICTAIGANATPASFNDSHVPDTSKMVKALKQSTASDWASLQSATSLVMDKLILALNELPELARAYHQV